MITGRRVVRLGRDHYLMAPPKPEKIPAWVWQQLEEQFEELSKADQYLVLASVELAPDLERSRILIPALSDAALEFMAALAAQEALRLEVDAAFEQRE
jgi:hypothetical protein